MYITNCTVTKSPQRVRLLNTWQESNTVGFHTGVDIQITEAYSMCDGVVLFVGQDRLTNLYSVIVQYNAQYCVSYSAINSADVTAGQPIQRGDRVGSAQKFIHFEWLTSNKPTTFLHPVRVGTATYYSIDPSPLLDGSIMLPDARGDVTFITNEVFSDAALELSPEAEAEFSDGR